MEGEGCSQSDYVSLAFRQVCHAVGCALLVPIFTGEGVSLLNLGSS